MFGYIRVLKPQMRICEYEQYQSVYCTLCRKAGREYGLMARLLLSYDYTFVAMLYMELHREVPQFEKGRCVYNPLKKCGVCQTKGEAFSLTGAMTAIMFYHKLRDNIADSRFFGKAGFGALKLLSYPMVRKAEKKYPDLAQAVADFIDAQNEAEKAENPTVDSVAEPTAQVISYLAQMLSEDEGEKQILARFGYYLGRWIYLIDALDDLEKDIKKKQFNPFARRFGLVYQDVETQSQVLLEAKIYANESLNMTLSMMAEEYEKLNIRTFGAILDNVVYLGMGNSQRMAMRIKENDSNE